MFVAGDDVAIAYLEGDITGEVVGVTGGKPIS